MYYGIDIAGKQFGSWKVLHKIPCIKGHHLKWMCQCECGIIKPVDGYSLRHGVSTNCGCKRKTKIENGLRTCFNCKDSKVPDAFRRKNGWCRECEKKAKKKHRLSKDVYSRYVGDRKGSLKKYNLTHIEFEQLIALQNNRCLICEREMFTGRGTGANKACIDHDHKCCAYNGSCGKCIRGILCNACNRGIALLQDSPEILVKAGAYLTNRSQIGTNS